MKKIISLVLMIAMLLIALPAMADDVRTSGNFQYTIKGNGTATIVGYTGEHADIILPNLIDGYTITTIGANAFASEKRLSQEISVTLPSTITAIEEMAFRNRSVRSINLPDALEYIGGGAFLGSDKINFRLSNNHPYFATINGSLYNKSNKELLKYVESDESSNDVIVPEGILSIGSYAFADMSIHYRANIILPQTLKKIGDYAFWSFQDSEGELIVPASVSEIGEYAFANANMKVSLALCSELATIPERAFCGIYGPFALLGTPRIMSAPTSIKIIEAYAFNDCDSLPIDALNNLLMNVETIGPYAFSSINGEGGCYFDPVVISGTCKVIGEGAFYNNFLVGGITIGEGVERIESKAFAKCNYEGSIYLPASLTYIALDAFDKEVTYVVEKGSYAERWVRDNAFTYTINGEEQNLDWLNN